MRPLLTVEPPPPPPMNEPTVVHRRIVQNDPRAPVAASRAMAVKEMSCAASVVPIIMPVSCCGKKPLGTTDVKPDGGDERCKTPDHQHEDLMAQHPFQARLVMAQQPVERPLAGPDKSARLARRRIPACRKREHSIGVSVSEMTPGNQDGQAQRDGEFVEQPPDQSAHEQQRNEHRHQRGAHRDDREADLPRALEAPPASAVSPCSMKRKTFSMTTMASSTTKPTEMVIAISERLSRL